MLYMSNRKTIKFIKYIKYIGGDIIMNLLVFFSIVFATIIFAIILERIINCPILIGFAFFSIFLIISAIFNNTILVIVAIALGILAFIVAFLDCIFKNIKFFRNSQCLGCDCENNSDSTLSIVNSSGKVVARIEDNNIVCNDNNEDNCSCGIKNCRRRY